MLEVGSRAMTERTEGRDLKEGAERAVCSCHAHTATGPGLNAL